MKAAAAIPVLSLLVAGVALADPAEGVLGSGAGRLIDQGVLGIAVVALAFAVWRMFHLMQAKDATAMANAMKVTEVLPAFTAELKSLRESIDRRGPGFGGPGTGGGE